MHRTPPPTTTTATIPRGCCIAVAVRLCVCSSPPPPAFSATRAATPASARYPTPLPTLFSRSAAPCTVTAVASCHSPSRANPATTTHPQQHRAERRGAELLEGARLVGGPRRRPPREADGDPPEDEVQDTARGIAQTRPDGEDGMVLGAGGGAPEGGVHGADPGTDVRGPRAVYGQQGGPAHRPRRATGLRHRHRGTVSRLTAGARRSRRRRTSSRAARWRPGRRPPGCRRRRRPRRSCPG